MSLWCHLEQFSFQQSCQQQTVLKVQTKGSNTLTPLNWIFSQQASHGLLKKMIIAHEKPFTFVEQLLF
jgi:hypothetical protein